MTHLPVIEALLSTRLSARNDRDEFQSCNQAVKRLRDSLVKETLSSKQSVALSLLRSFAEKFRDREVRRVRKYEKYIANSSVAFELLVDKSTRFSNRHCRLHGYLISSVFFCSRREDIDVQWLLVGSRD